ncbi:MAG: GNAT family N-acetyltransferase [Gaiellaceae bacterium]
MIRPLGESDGAWAEAVLNEEFGGRLQARRGELIDVLALPGFVAEREGRRVGLLTYRREDGECELAFIGVLERHRGIGTALLDALHAEVADCGRIWLVTTNDNVEALRFYQRRGYVLAALRPGAVDDARWRLKPQISTVGEFGIPLRDEIELELRWS